MAPSVLDAFRVKERMRRVSRVADCDGRWYGAGALTKLHYEEKGRKAGIQAANGIKE